MIADLSKTLSQHLQRAGVSLDRAIPIKGENGVVVTRLASRSGRAMHPKTDAFDVFIPTRPVVLNEVSGEFDRRTFTYNVGMVGFTPPGVDWTIEWEGLLEGIVFVIEPATMNAAVNRVFEAASETSSWRTSLAVFAPAIAYLGLDLSSQLQTHYPAGEDVIVQELNTFLMLIARRFSYTNDRDTSQVGLLSQQVLSALRFIDANLSEPVAVEDVARESGASATHLNRLFRAELGTSVWGHVQQRRLYTATEMLLETSHSLTEIAKRCGYRSADNVRRQFKKGYGLTPAEYKRRHLDDAPLI